jgi:outer membrane protein W
MNLNMKKPTLELVFLLLFLAAHAQERKRKPTAYNKQKQQNEEEKFLEKQWWLGFKAGANLSKATVEKSYAIVSPTNYSPNSISKQYDDFTLVGPQATLEVSFYFKRFLFSFQPTYQSSRFTYTNDFEWTSDTEANNRVELHFNQEHKVDHAVLPLVIKYDVYGHKLRPYVQVGVYTALLLNATKTVTISGIDNAAGGDNEFETEAITIGAKDLFAKSHWGLLGGVGLNYNLRNNVRLNLDIMYKYGMSNISSTENRYESDRLAGVGDALDDITLDNLSVSLGVLFPLRFLSNSFKSLDH